MAASALILGILILVMACLFVTERISADIVALTGLAIITVLGYVTPEQAFAGFVSPVIVTMISMFFIGGALKRTGIAGQLARIIGRYMGAENESRVVAVVMLLSALLSAGMNNVTAMAVLLPAVMAISQQTGVASTRLLMPASFGVILGGTITAIGTTPNLLMLSVMEDAGIVPFSFLSYAPYGLAVTALGTLYVSVWGRAGLPARKQKYRDVGAGSDLARLYKLSDRLFSLHVAEGSPLVGQSLRQSRFGSILGTRVVAIKRHDFRQLHPSPDEELRAHDHLIIQGRRSRITALLRFKNVELQPCSPDVPDATGEALQAALLTCEERFAGKELRELHLLEEFSVQVLTVSRDTMPVSGRIDSETLQRGDVIHIVGPQSGVARLQQTAGLVVEPRPFEDVTERGLFQATVPADPALSGRSIRELRFGELIGIQAIAVVRDGKRVWQNLEEYLLRAGDSLLLVADEQNIKQIQALATLEVDPHEADGRLESRDMVLAEVIFPPRSSAIGKSLLEINFRERFDSQVLAVLREGQSYRSDLATYKLRLGDALLIHSPRSKLALLREDSDFVVLGDVGAQAIPLLQSVAAVLAFFMVICLSIAGVLPVHVAAVIGALVVLLSRAIRIEDGYEEVSWKVVFLVAALIPFGTALNTTGATETLGQAITYFAGPLGFPVSVILLSLVASVMSQLLDAPVAVVLMAPIALKLVSETGGDPHIMLMAITLSTSIAFVTPFSHKSNLIVMAAGGYRTRDFLRPGIPLTIICFTTIWVMLLCF